MTAYVIRRLLLMIPTVFMVTVITFAAVRFIPGDIIDQMVSEKGVPGAAAGADVTAAYIRHQMGLDVPIHIQYGRWIAAAFRGDLGESLWSGQDIVKDIIKRLPVSLELGLIAIATAVLMAIPIGTFSALRQDTVGDYAARTFAVLAISVPSFWIGTMIIVYPSIYFGWTPPMQYVPITENLGANLLQFAIPGILVGMVMSGTDVRLTRTMMLEVLRQDYIRTAWSKGLRERAVVLRHALKNALIPVITDLALLLPTMIAGMVVIETIFSLPGMGRYFIGALSQRDYPIVSAVTLVVATSVVMFNLLVDLAYAWLDPRVTYK
jgi:peptide/nickel transport system permease protein